jgi:uncharacterized protein (TIGR02001 family)
MKTIIKSAVLATAFASPLVLADGHEGSRLEASGNVAFTTDYVYRGISRSDSRMAVQGGLDLGYAITDAVSVYVGSWGSNVDIDTFAFNKGNNVSAEFNIFGGLNGNLLGIDWDLGGLGYFFPGENDFDYQEAYGSLGRSFVIGGLQPSISVGVNFSPDHFNETGDAFYGWSNIDIGLPSNYIPGDLTLNAHGGRQWIQDNAKFGTPDYWEWSAGMTYTVLGFDLGVHYHDTEISGNACFSGRSICDARVVATFGRAL